MQLAYIQYYDDADYLANEACSPTKHEYVAGEIFAVAGASKRHATLALNIAIALRQHLRGKPCAVWMADIKVHVQEDSAYYYPDVVVTCDAADLSAEAPPNYLNAPKLIVEVLSDSTESVDRREKLLSYRRLPSLIEYILIDQNKARVEVYRRSTNNNWQHEIYEPDEAVHLSSVELDLPMQDIYADIKI